MPKLETKVPPQVTNLVNHLKSTGTGQAKLDKLSELGKVAKDGEEFLASAKLMMPPGTWAKIETYLSEQEGELTTAPENKGRVESKDDSQSSIPERTVLLENRSVQLKQPGPGNVVRQLGADTIVDPKTDPLGKDGGDSAKGEGLGSDKEEGSSPVADQNATDAKAAVGRMTSKDKLEKVVMFDDRKTVQEAAQARLDELSK